MNIKLTPLQAFNTMKIFLENYYKKTNSDDVGALLGAMQFFPDGGTYDPAIWNDWIDYIGTSQSVTPLEAYIAMLKFLEFYLGNSDSHGLQAFISELQLSNENKINNSTVWNDWLLCIEDALI